MPTSRCRIVEVGRRRDGGTRYWCLAHRADATAKYGTPARACRYAHIPPVQASEILPIDMGPGCGGIALWGAVPAVYDTTRQPLDRGIHVHRRETSGAHKTVDATWRAVELTRKKVRFLITDIDAIYYMVSTVFRFGVRHVCCTLCGYPHLDKDWFSIHPHRRHLCAGCGRTFSDTETAVGNPVQGIREALGLKPQGVINAPQTLHLRQEDYPGGIQIWGSNQALVWTMAEPEMSGIHVHAYKSLQDQHPAIDETYSEVVVDGVRLDPAMVRTMMAQSALPHLAGRVTDLRCVDCGMSKFDVGEHAFTPAVDHRCACGARLAARTRLRKVIANPLVAALRLLAERAPRAPQMHDLGLLPETL